MDIGWLLYSTHQQDEEHIANMMTLPGENIGVKWKPVCTISDLTGRRTHKIPLSMSMPYT
jgi:hypothetical protein